MKLSELIEAAQILLRHCGDIPVRCHDGVDPRNMEPLTRMEVCPDAETPEWIELYAE